MVRNGIVTAAGILLLFALGWLNSKDNTTSFRTAAPPHADGSTAPTSVRVKSPQTFDGSLVSLPNRSSLNLEGSMYVPAYSTIRVGDGKGRPLELAVTLSLQNTSRSKPLVLERVDYHDTAGQLIESYVQEPVALKPFGAVEIFIPYNDLRGGTGANFFVKWAAEAPISEPIAEVMMIGTYGSAGFSLVSQGRQLDAN
jgi:hypothetical protein